MKFMINNKLWRNNKFWSKRLLTIKVKEKTRKLN